MAKSKHRVSIRKQEVQIAKHRKRKDKAKRKEARQNKRNKGYGTNEDFLRTQNILNIGPAIKSGQELNQLSPQELILKTYDRERALVAICKEASKSFLHSPSPKLQTKILTKLVNDFNAIFAANIDSLKTKDLEIIFTYLGKNSVKGHWPDLQEATMNLYANLEEFSERAYFRSLLNPNTASAIIGSLVLARGEESSFARSNFIRITRDYLIDETENLNLKNILGILRKLKFVDIQELDLEQLAKLLIKRLNSLSLDRNALRICESFLGAKPKFAHLLDINKVRKELKVDPKEQEQKPEAKTLFEIACQQLSGPSASMTVEDFAPFNQIGLNAGNNSSLHKDPIAFSKYLRGIRRIAEYAYKNPETIPLLKLDQHQATIHKLLSRIDKTKYLEDEVNKINSYLAYQELSLIEYLLRELKLLESDLPRPASLTNFARSAMQNAISSDIERRVQAILTKTLAEKQMSPKSISNENHGLQYGGFACDIICKTYNGGEIHLEVDGKGHAANSSITDELRDKYFRDWLNIPVLRLKIDEDNPIDESIKSKLEETGIYELLAS